MSETRSKPERAQRTKKFLSKLGGKVAAFWNAEPREPGGWAEAHMGIRAVTTLPPMSPNEREALRASIRARHEEALEEQLSS